MTDIYPILAVETSGELCSVAILPDNKDFVELNYSKRFIHSRKIIEMTDEVMKIAELEVNDLKCIAVSIGPGSFTGLRIGLSAAKGIAFGANLPVISVPTFSAYALHFSNYISEGTPFNIAVKANMDEAYFAKYLTKGTEVITVDELKLVAVSEINNLIGENETVIGNVNIKAVPTEVIFPGAAAIGKWAYLFGKDLLTFQYDYLEPNYFKNFIPKVRS